MMGSRQMRKNTLRALGGLVGVAAILTTVGTVNAFADHEGSPPLSKLFNDCNVEHSCKITLTD
jgi:hypothetical protein